MNIRGHSFSCACFLVKQGHRRGRSVDDRLASIELEHAVVTVTDPQEIATYLRLFATMPRAAEFGQAARSGLDTIGGALSGQR